MHVFLDCFAVSKRKHEKEIDMQTITKTTTNNSIMSVKQAAEYLGLAVSTLNKWRCHGGGPVFVKMGRAVRYRIADLDKFIVERSMTSTSSTIM